MAANVTTVATWIAGLSVDGLAIRDLSNIPEEVFPHQCPLLTPEPAQFVSNVVHTRISFRVGVARSYSLTYTLCYKLFYAPVAEGISLFSNYRGMVDKWSAVLTEIIENETPSGAYDIRPTGNPVFGPIADQTGNVYHGCQFDLLVTEFN